MTLSPPENSATAKPIQSPETRNSSENLDPGASDKAPPPPHESSSAAPSFLAKIARKNEPFLASTWGQRLLLILAPFILLPGESGQQNNQLRSLFERLHTGLWSPLLGAFFFMSSLVVTLKAYQNLGLHFEWFVDYGSGRFLVLTTALLSLVAYNGAFARWAAPHGVRLFTKTKETACYSFRFWTIRYGGLLAFFGLIGWFFTGVTWLDLPWWAFLLAIGVLILGVYLARKEIGFQHQRLLSATPGHHVRLLHLFEVILFSALSGVQALLYFLFAMGGESGPLPS